MTQGFYKELENRRRSGSAADFGFLEEIPVVGDSGKQCVFLNGNSSFELSLLDFLHGSCHIFSRYLHDKFGYKVCNIFTDNGHLIHSYCVDPDGNYVDVRGKISDLKAFFSEFEDEIDLTCLGDYPTHGKIAALANELDRNMYRAAGYVVRDYYRFYCN